MFEDPIVEETRREREQYAGQSREQQHPERIVKAERSSDAAPPKNHR